MPVSPVAFHQGRVWAYLRANPGRSAAQISVALFGDRRRTITSLLHRMKVRGSIRCEGWTQAARWWATDLKPVDVRGYSPGSIEAIERGQEQWMRRLQAANVARGVHVPVIKPRPYKATALEQHFGWGVER